MSFTNIASQGYNAKVSVTRPANVTPYTAGDVVGAAAAAITFPYMGPGDDRQTGRGGAEIWIVATRLRIDVSAVPTGMTSFRLHLYSATPVSALADNAAWDLTSGDYPSYLGYVDLGTPVDTGSTLWVQQSGLQEPFRLASGSTTLYGYLVTNGGFTPAGNSEVYTVGLHAVAM